MHHVSRGGRGVGESHWRFYTSLSRLSHNHPSLVFHLIVWTCLATCAGLSAEFDFKSGGSCEKKKEGEIERVVRQPLTVVADMVNMKSRRTDVINAWGGQKYI